MGVLFKSKSGHVPDYYKQKRRAEARAGRSMSCAEFESAHLEVRGGVFFE